MKKIKTGYVELMQINGYGTKKRLADIERIEKLLKRERYQPLAKILDHNIRPNLYCFLMYYDSIKPARYSNTRRTIKVNGKAYKFIYINDLIYKTKVHYAQREYKKMSNSKGRWSEKLNVFVLLGLIEKIQLEQIPAKDRTFNFRGSEDLKNKMIEEVTKPLKNMLEKTKNENEKKALQKKIKQIEKYWKSVCYYYVPKFTKETFIKANEIAKIMIQNHFTQGKFDRFWVDNAFGTDKAQEIFTEYTGRTKELNEREMLVENTIIETVKKYKCCTRKQVVDNVPLEDLKIYHIKPWENIKQEEQYKKRVAEQIFRDIIEQVKQKYGFEYKRLNAEEKKKYNKNTSKWYIFKREE